MCVDIVWEWRMIAVIMVIIPAMKGSLGYCVFVLLPCLGSGLHNPHSSYSLGSKIAPLNSQCSRCPVYSSKCFVCPWFAIFVIFLKDEFEGVRRPLLRTWVISDLHGVSSLSRCLCKEQWVILSTNSLMDQWLYTPRLVSQIFHPICEEESCFSAITEF